MESNSRNDPLPPLSAEKLQRVFQSLKPGAIPDALRLLRDTRELLEATATKETFDVVGLYCDWSLHTEISGSLVAHNILVRANDILIELVKRVDPNSGPHVFTAAVTRALSIDRLRRQLLDLYKAHNIIAPFLHSFRQWHLLLGEIFKEVADKPLRLVSSDVGKPARGGRGQRIRTELEAKWSAVDRTLVPLPLLVEELVFAYKSDQPDDNFGMGRLCWSAAVRHDGRTLWLTTPMIPLESPTAFSTP